MKIAYEKPILMTIEFCGLYVGLTSSFMIQVIQVCGRRPAVINNYTFD